MAPCSRRSTTRLGIPALPGSAIRLDQSLHVIAQCLTGAQQGPKILAGRTIHPAGRIECCRTDRAGSLKQGLYQAHEQRRLGELLLLGQAPDDLLSLRRHTYLQYFRGNHETHCVPTAAARLSRIHGQLAHYHTLQVLFLLLSFCWVPFAPKQTGSNGSVGQLQSYIRLLKWKA